MEVAQSEAPGAVQVPAAEGVWVEYVETVRHSATPNGVTAKRSPSNYLGKAPELPYGDVKCGRQRQGTEDDPFRVMESSLVKTDSKIKLQEVYQQYIDAFREHDNPARTERAFCTK